MKKILYSAGLALVMMVAVIGMTGQVRAQTPASSAQDTINQLKNQLQALQQQLDALRSQWQTVHNTQTEIKDTLKIFRQLREGVSGDDVQQLQQIFAAYPDIYPSGKITGFFGPLTKEAVKRYQRKFGLDAVGEVGPKTRAHLHVLWVQGSGSVAISATSTGTASGSVNIVNFFPPGIAKKIQNDEDEGHGMAVCHRPPGNPTNAQTIHVGVRALRAHLKHGDMLGACAEKNNGGTGTTTPPVDTTAPIISGLTATSTNATSTIISWTTNEPANSNVWYGTTTPVAVGTGASMVFVSTPIPTHLLPLSGLAASTTYYYLAVSSDPAGNTATSTQQSFMTLGL